MKTNYLISGLLLWLVAMLPLAVQAGYLQPDPAMTGVRGTVPADLPAHVRMQTAQPLSLGAESLAPIQGHWSATSGVAPRRVTLSPRTATPASVAGFYLETDTVNTTGGYRTRSSRIVESTNEAGNVQVMQLYGSSLTNCFANVSGSTITFPTTGVVPVSNSDGATAMAVICPVDFATGTVYVGQPLKGTIEADGTIRFPAWGIFVVDGSDLNAVAVCLCSEMHRANAYMTGTQYGTSSTVEWGVIVSQPYKNRVVVENIANTGEPAVLDLLSDGSVQVTPQYMGTATNVGEMDIMPLRTTGTGEITMMHATVSNGAVTFPSWGVCAVNDPSKYAVRMTSSRLVAETPVTIPASITGQWSGSGSQTDPYKIASYNDLLLLADKVNAGNDMNGNYFTLTADINCANQEYYFTPIGYINEYSDFGVSNSKPTGAAFAGTFDGAGHSIKNLSYETGRRPYIGVFTWLSDRATVKGLTVTNAMMINYGIGEGGIAGINYGTISGCASTGNALNLGQYNLGGIAGVNKGTIHNCSAYNSMLAYGDMGGISGCSTGTITNCLAEGSYYFRGVDNSLHARAGGLVGSLNGAYTVDGIQAVVDGCITTALIDTRNSAGETGGLAGGILSNTTKGPAVVKRSLAMVTISSGAADNTSGGTSGRVGGFTGSLYNGTIQDCMLSGMLMATYAPSMCGLGAGYVLSNAKVENSYSALQVYFGAKQIPEKVMVFGNLNESNLQGVTNFYYDRQITGVECALHGFAGAKNTAEMTTAAGLPGFSTDTWTFTEGLYPMVKQIAASKATMLAAAPVFFADGQNALMVKNDFTLTTTNNVRWGVLVDGGLSNTGQGFDIQGNKAVTKNEYGQDILAANATGTNFIKEYIIKTVPSGMFAGAGTEENPYQIRTVDDLVTLADETTSRGITYKGTYFRVTNDIDVAGDPAFQGIAADGNKNHMFSGVIDGAGHTIDGIVLDKARYDASGKAVTSGSVSYVGFVGILGADGVIKNLTLGSNCSITTMNWVGGMVGLLDGTIENCAVMGSVNAYSTYSGGLVGQMTKTATVRSSRFAGTVRGGLNNIGGIAGYSYGVVENCQNDGTVLGDSINAFNTPGKARYAGGIVGYLASGVVRNCVNNGSVLADNSVGGIVGYSMKSSTGVQTDPEISGSLTTGTVDSRQINNNCGAVIGATTATGIHLDNNFYDCQIFPYGAVDGQPRSGCTGLLTTQLTATTLPEGLVKELFDVKAGCYPVLKTFAGTESTQALRGMVLTLAGSQNVDNVSSDASLGVQEGMTWTVEQSTPVYAVNGNTLTVASVQADVPLTGTLTAANGLYKRVFALTTIPKVFEGQGTGQSPFLIRTPADMKKLATWVNANNVRFDGNFFRLENDLDYTGITDYEPVGYNTAIFGGRFDGNGHSITNLTCTHLTEAPVALFGNVNEHGAVTNLTLKNSVMAPGVDADGKQSTKAVAGFVVSLGGEMRNCTNYAEIDGSKGTYAAGLVYEMNGKGSMDKCTNHGTVKAKGTRCAGIVANIYAENVLTGCVNDGQLISESDNVAGIAGYAYGGTIENCSNSAAITSAAGKRRGGIVGFGAANYILTISNCTNTGDLSRTGTGTYAYFGGIIGEGDGYTRISNCVNRGNITTTGTGSAYVGGIVGTLNSNKCSHTLKDCMNYGSLSVTGNYVGGIAGQVKGNSSDTTRIDRCYNYGPVSYGTSYAGGLFGDLYMGMVVTDCANAAALTAKEGATGMNVGGLAGTSYADMVRCYNTGDINNTGYGTAGLVGQATGAHFYECFNLGKVTTTAVGTTSNFAAAGLVARGRGFIYNCYNMGDVTAPDNVAGVVGYWSTTIAIQNTYAACKVTATKEDAVNAHPFIGSKPSSATYTNNYFDNTLCPLANADSQTAQGCATREMYSLSLGDKWRIVAACYPTLLSMENVSEANFAACQVMTKTIEESLSNVKHTLTIGLLPGVTWICSADLEIKDNHAAILALGKPGTSAWLKKTAGELSQTYNLVLNENTGVAEIDEATVVKVEYYLPSGMKIVSPLPGQTVIEKVILSDGTARVTKRIYR